MKSVEKRKELINDFEEIIQDLIINEKVLKMQEFNQHYNTTCFEHCHNVAFYSYIICRKLNLDYISASRAGMLHDLFLYNWRNSRKTIPLDGYHAFVHPKIALKNAMDQFNLNEKEQDIILKQMWPLTIRLPRYIESYIVSFVDKYCAILESRNYYIEWLRSKKIYKYAYIFLTMFFFRIF